MIWLRGLLSVVPLAALLVSASRANQGPTRRPSPNPSPAAQPVVLTRFVERYCIVCHSAPNKTAGLAFDVLSKQSIGHRSEIWEKVVRKLRGRQMPPVGSKR